jgi:glycosyltransferase involved in cell wall biosynthesis
MGRKLRVLNIVGALELGGTEQYVTRVAPLLRNYGIEVEICLLDKRGPLVQAAEAAGITVHGTDARRRKSRSLAYAGLATVIEIASLIRRTRFDIVHSYLFHAEAIGTLAARLSGSSRAIISRRAVYPWRRPNGSLYLALETATNILATELIANSRTVLRDVEHRELLLPRLRTVIYNGVDVAHYSPARTNKSGPLRVVTVGVLAPRKGQEYAIRAVRLLADAGIETRLTLVGGGSDELLLRRIASEQCVESSIVFAGPQLDPRPFLQEADVFLLPSRQEGFSNALLEAMACSLPVVATDVGGNAEALVDGTGGFIVPPLDAAALATALTQLAQSRDQLTAMGQTNRRRVEELFSLDSSVRELAAWYGRS